MCSRSLFGLRGVRSVERGVLKFFTKYVDYRCIQEKLKTTIIRKAFFVKTVFRAPHSEDPSEPGPLFSSNQTQEYLIPNCISDIFLILTLHAIFRSKYGEGPIGPFWGVSMRSDRSHKRWIVIFKFSWFQRYTTWKIL